MFIKQSKPGFWSRPARDAWIETSMIMAILNLILGRVPHGTRGLKRFVSCPWLLFVESRPARDAWIETGRQGETMSRRASRPARDAWIETGKFQLGKICNRSRPARDAWIETVDSMAGRAKGLVASRTGRVD